MYLLYLWLSNATKIIETKHLLMPIYRFCSATFDYSIYRAGGHNQIETVERPPFIQLYLAWVTTSTDKWQFLDSTVLLTESLKSSK